MLMLMMKPLPRLLGNATETATVDENTHEFFTELTEAGTYRVLVTTLSSAGDCEARESSAHTGFTFYLGETGPAHTDTPGPAHSCQRSFMS